jgi:hypothetical protein
MPRPVRAVRAVDDDLRRVAEARAVGRLLRGLARGERGAREAVLPAEPVPVVDVEGEGDDAGSAFSADSQRSAGGHELQPSDV